MATTCRGWAKAAGESKDSRHKKRTNRAARKSLLPEAAQAKRAWLLVRPIFQDFALFSPRSDLLGHHEGFPVLAGEQLVGLRIIDKPLGLRIHLQDCAQCGRRLREIDIIGSQMLFHAAERLGQVLVALD